MAALKKHMMTILFGVAVAGSLGLAAWFYTAGDAVSKKVTEINTLAGTVRSAANGPANVDTINKRWEISQRRNEQIDATVESTLRPQKFNTFENRPRQLLLPDILPEIKSDAAKIDFKRKYNEAFAELNQRLRARDEPTYDEIRAESESLGGEADIAGGSQYPWDETPTASGDGPRQVIGEVTVAEALRSQATSRVAERIAKGIFMYVDALALGPHNAGDEKTNITADNIWQAHMTLWIAQDFAAALASLNEARAAQLEAAGRGYDAWVAHMPVKRIKQLTIDDKLGRGGGINVGMRMVVPESFTRDNNDSQHFMVPLRLTLIVEEASVMDVLDAICSAGYYTPIRVEYHAVPPNPLQEDRIYGDDPVVEMTIDMEGYFFRVVYEEWIPKELKPILATPDAVEERKGRG